jgi:shikimate kinase
MVPLAEINTAGVIIAVSTASDEVSASIYGHFIVTVNNESNLIHASLQRGDSRMIVSRRAVSTASKETVEND